MTRDFYYLSGSPFAWKVWLALERKALDYDLHVLSAAGGDLAKPDFRALNPRGKVPVLVDGGTALAESDAIVEYLEDKYPDTGGPLWPNDVKERAIARRIAAEANAYVYPHVRTLMRELLMKGGAAPDETAVTDAKASLAKEFAAIASSIRGPFAMGVEPSIADFTLYPMAALVMLVQSRLPERDVVAALPQTVRDWMAHIEALPYFAKTIPPHWTAS